MAEPTLRKVYVVSYDIGAGPEFDVFASFDLAKVFAEEASPDPEMKESRWEEGVDEQGHGFWDLVNDSLGSIMQIKEREVVRARR